MKKVIRELDVIGRRIVSHQEFKRWKFEKIKMKSVFTQTSLCWVERLRWNTRTYCIHTSTADFDFAKVKGSCTSDLKQ